MLSADKLRFLRIKHNITQKEMAKQINKSLTWIIKIESGEYRPSEETYQDWLNACYKAQKKEIVKKLGTKIENSEEKIEETNE